MDTYYLIIALTYFIVGFAVSIVFHYALGRPMLGGFWGGLLVGLLGAFIGGTLGSVFMRVELVVIAESVDVIPPIVVSIGLMWVFTSISKRNFR